MNEQFTIRFDERQRKQVLSNIEGEARRSSLWQSLRANDFDMTVFDRNQAREIYQLCMSLGMRVIDIAGLNYTNRVIIVRCVRGVGMMARGAEAEVMQKQSRDYNRDHTAEYRGDYSHIFEGLVVGEHEFAVRSATPFNGLSDDGDIYYQIVGYKKAVR